MLRMSPSDKKLLVSRIALELGFSRVGFARAEPIERGGYLREWLAGGRAGTMGYLHRNEGLRRDPSELFEGARSVIVVAANYRRGSLVDRTKAAETGTGRVAMYALGEDYHVVVKDRLRELVSRLEEAVGEPMRSRVCVDTVPIIERELAARAGVGWIGKNTLVMHQDLGSTFFLGEVVTSLEFEYDEPATDHCGRCTRCLDACPTGAFPAAYEMDASRCISYLTIEHRADDIGDELARGMGDWIFGCDICQAVCPFNRDGGVGDGEMFSRRVVESRLSLGAIGEMTEEAFEGLVSGSAMNRASLEMMRRNARIAAENERGL
jgi:epoxyqueuosine reductase